MFAAANLFETIYNLRSVRKFKPDPVEEEKIKEALRAATMAPNAINIQPWRFVVVRSQEVKDKIRQIAVKAFNRLMRYGVVSERNARMYGEGRFMVENTDKVPVLIFVFGDPTPYFQDAKAIARLGFWMKIPQALKHLNLNMAASIYPAIENMLLAAKGLGLGACMTTSIILKEGEVQRLLKVPEHLRLFSLVYLGYPLVELKRPKRRSAEEFTYFDGW